MKFLLQSQHLETNSGFTLATGHGTVQYGTVRYAYFFRCKQVLFQAEAYQTGLTWPANPTMLAQYGTAQ